MPISIRLKPGIEKRLEKLAKKTGRTKSWYIRNAIEDYLQEWEDYYIALSRLENETGEMDVSEVRKRLGLAG